MSFQLETFDPIPLPPVGVFDGEVPDTTSLMALTFETKYQFLDETGAVFHEYILPNDPDVYYLSGYVGKIVYYRDPSLLEYLRSQGISKESFQTEEFPILATQSPQIDLVVYQLIQFLRESFRLDRVKLFDLGCTVAEHYDLLDTLLKASSDGRDDAAGVLSYRGLDRSARVLSVAAMMHPKPGPEHFRLLRAEGSDFDFEDNEVDLTLSMGVINHVRDPIKTLENVIRASRYACVIELWVTPEKEGFWAINHRGAPFYFFSKADLSTLESALGGRFLVFGYRPDVGSSQQKSFVGIGQEKMEGLGSYQLVFTALSDLPFSFQPLLS